jgi:uncharacterized protein YkwD
VNGTPTHSPDLGAVMDAYGSAGWTTVGENIASGGTASEVVSACMNSPAHRTNILNPSFTTLGMGSVAGVGRAWSSTEVRRHR